MSQIRKSKKLDNVCYDIRGPVLEHAKRMEEEGHRIIKLNIGNPAAFGFEAPDEITQDVVRNINKSSGYTESFGLFEPRKAIMHYTQQKNISDVEVDDIVLGNGVSELIVMAMQGLINNEDEVLIPKPDYPLWTASVTLAGGNPVHYRCDEDEDWFQDLDDIKEKYNHSNERNHYFDNFLPRNFLPEKIQTQWNNCQKGYWSFFGMNCN